MSLIASQPPKVATARPHGMQFASFWCIDPLVVDSDQLPDGQNPQRALVGNSLRLALSGEIGGFWWPGLHRVAADGRLARSLLVRRSSCSISGLVGPVMLPPRLLAWVV